MAISCGFFNSLNGDRKYDAIQLSSIFDGIIEDGIFQAIDDAFAVTAADDGSGIVVGAGRAWFDHTWTRNDAGYPLDLEQSEVVLDRIDMVVLEVDSSSPVRNNTIKIVKGTPSSNPTKPSPANTETLHQHPLAYLTRPAGTETITQSQIESVIGTEECPFVTGPLKTISADAMLAQWQAEFDEWFESLEDTLSGDVAANLANQIMQKVDKTNVLDTVEEIEATTEEGYVAGALAAKDMVDMILGNSEEVANGCIAFPNGFMIQFGRGVLPSTAYGGSGYAIIDFKKPFINTNYTMLAVSEYTSGIVTFICSCQRVNQNRMFVYGRTIAGGIVTGALVYWAALGRWK